MTEKPAEEIKAGEAAEVIAVEAARTEADIGAVAEAPAVEALATPATPAATPTSRAPGVLTSIRGTFGGIFDGLQRGANWMYRHKLLSLLGAGIIGFSLGLGYRASRDGIYNGTVDSWKVSYVENDGIFSDSNYMAISKSGVKYEFFDTEDFTGINWNSVEDNKFGLDTLERIIYRDKNGEQEFLVGCIGNGTIKGAKTEEIFSKGNSLYYSIREKMREKLRNAEYNKLDKVKSHLDKQ